MYIDTLHTLGQCFVWVRQYSLLEHRSIGCFAKKLSEIFKDILLLISQEPGFVPFFRNKFPGLFQVSDWFFQDSQIHINPFTSKISMLILCIFFFNLILTDFRSFPAPVALFQSFPGFPGPVRTLKALVSRECTTGQPAVWEIRVNEY